jgi:hypothetical protein
MAAKARHSSSSTFAVVMGDIVDSEKASSSRTLSRKFNSAITIANSKFEDSLASPLTITLGDEFQGLSRSATRGFEIITNLRFELLRKKVSCRFVLGIVDLKTEVNSDKAWNMMGAGFAQARKRLNEKSDPNAYRFSIDNGSTEKESPTQRLLNAVGISLTMVEGQWTETQQRYIQLRQSNNSAEQIAKRLMIGPRSYYKVLEAAKWHYHTEQREAILYALAVIDQELKMS